MKSYLNLGLASVLGFGIGLLVMKTANRNSKVNLKIEKTDEQQIKSIFSSGCEVGIMKYCEVAKQEDCRRYCLLFLEANPDVYEMLTQGIVK